MSDERWERLDQLLELLTDEVVDRLRGEQENVERQPIKLQESSHGALERPMRDEEPAPTTRAEADTPPSGGGVELPGSWAPEDSAVQESSAPPGVSKTRGEGGCDPEPKPPSPPTPHTARFLGRLALGLFVLIVAINIPFNRHGTTLATAMPDRRALVIRDGLVVKEEDEPEIYIFQDGRFRWISSLKAFEMQGYAWRDVHVVADGFLEPYEIGPPIHLIVKCNESPHIYRIEGEEKRWIVDIDAFEEAGHIWADVEFVSCEYLRSLPDGQTIPPGHGPPPQP